MNNNARSYKLRKYMDLEQANLIVSTWPLGVFPKGFIPLYELTFNNECFGIIGEVNDVLSFFDIDEKQITPKFFFKERKLLYRVIKRRNLDRTNKRLELV